jgi:hypothetical protein
MSDPSTWFDILLKIGPFVIKGYLWIRNRIKWHGISEDARKIAFAINSFSWTNLQQAAPVINRVGLITRPEIEQIQNIWRATDTPLLLQGEAGTGKSGIALRLGQTLANNGIPVIFLRATDFPSGQDPAVIIQNRMALSIPLMDALAKLSKERTFSVIVDQLDSAAGTDLCKNFISFLKALAGIPNVKVLAVSRTYESLQDPDISALGFQMIESGHLTNEQSLQYLCRLGLIEPSQNIVDLASNLLNLSLISDVVTLTPDYSKAIIDEVELWKQFLATIQQREGNEAAEFVLRLALEVTTKGEHHFSVQFPNMGIRRKLLSRGILMESPARRFFFRHEQLQDFLCAYSLIPEQPTVVLLLGKFGNNIPQDVISWLHLLFHTECPDIEPTFIDDVLEAKGKLRFFTRIQVLENLKKQIDPNENVARVLQKHFRIWAYHRFFFEDLENSAWIVQLYRVGFFHHPPDPIEVQPGSFQLPGWPAGEYLARFAERYEEIVIDVVQSVRTENYRVQTILVDALIKISPTTAAGQVSAIDTWLAGRFSDMLPNKLISLADHLVEAEFVDATIQILECIITPILPPTTDEYSKYHSPIRFRSDPHWVNEYCKKQFLKLMNLNPVGVILAFERQLEKTIELAKQVNPEEAEIQVGYYWRMDIPNHSSEMSDTDALDILIDGLRDGLAELCNKSVEEGGIFLKTYLISEHLILQRIALFTLCSYGQNYPELVNQVLLQRNYLESIGFGSEYRGLLRNQFANASEEVREKVINWVITGPMDVDSRAIRHAEWENREATDDDRREVQEEWILYHLEIIRDFLSGEILDLLNELTVRYGKPDIEEKNHTVTTSWRGVPSPVTVEELVRKSFEELKELFITYVPDDLFLNPRESLARVFQGVVRDDPARYSLFAKYLCSPEIRFVYIYNYLSGIRESLKNPGINLRDEIISLCEYVINQEEDPFEESSDRYEAGLYASQMEVVRLLEEALQSEDPYLTREQLDRIRSILITLAHHPDPVKDEDSGSGFDPFTQSLNCVRGVAMHGIMHFSLYNKRQQEKLKNEEIKVDFLEPEIQEVLEEKLDLSIEPSLAVHSVFGAFVPQLHYLSHGWLEKHLIAIFPENEEKNAYWRAAWDAYIFSSNVYRDVFKLLVPQYQRGLKLLSQPHDEQKHLGGSPNERLAQHLMSAYLAGLTNFRHKNSLLDLFYANAPDPVRANGIFWLSQVLGNDKPLAEDMLWKKCWYLWQNRLRDAETQEISQNTQEISDYMRWLENCPVALNVLYPTLCLTVKYLHSVFDASQLTSYAAVHCESFPLEAVTLLQMTILAAKEPWWTPEEKDEEKILRVAMASGNCEAMRIASEVINYRGEQGDFRWKYLLQG